MQHIYEKLNITIDNGLHIFNKDMDVENFPQRLNKSLKIINPTSIFIFNNKPIILFFDKDVDKKEVFKQCWNFSETPIVIINNDDNLTFEIYNGFEYIKNNESLGKINNDNELTYISLVSGKYFENSDKIFDQKNKVDKKLLENIKDARNELLSKLLNKELDEKIKIINKDKKKKLVSSLSLTELKVFRIQRNITNSLMGRLIFIRYLIDRNVKFSINKILNGKNKEAKKEEFKRILSSKEETYELFEYLKSDKGFNGDWFPIINDDKNKIYEKEIVEEKHLDILLKLLNGYSFKDNQDSLFEFYDFSIIPIEFISNVYESFMGEEYQKESGAYYTPTFLVDYTLKYTVDKYFQENKFEYNCKVLDPACGSGIFLVETLRKLINQFKKLHNNTITQEQIKELVINNIYGIDKDENAVQISIFSLYLTMLDYQTPVNIAKFKFPYLLRSNKNVNPNFFNDDFFDLDARYNDILKEKKVNFIIGNPPYGRSTIKKDSFADIYIKENKFEIGSQDIVQPFMIRIKDFSSQNTQIAFIITSKILYNIHDKAKAFRKYFFNKFEISHLLELSSVRKEIFENAVTPVSILFYKHSNKKKILTNTIRYISVKPNPFFSQLKMLFISKSDFKKVLQSKLIENDYLWKILVYGSYLDFNFIKKLRTKSIADISEENGYSKGMGIQATKGKNDISYHIGKDFIDVPRGKQSDKYMSSFYIADNLPKWNIEKVYRKGNDKLFNKYSVLIRRGVSPETFRAKSAILYKEAVFKHTLTGVNVSNKEEAKNFMGIINSSLFTYYNLEVASSFGIEREQLHDEEKLQAPYVKDKNIVSVVSEIENLQIEHFNTNSSNTLNYNNNFENIIKQLDETVLEAFNLNEEEYSLIDYANNIVIPWITRRNDIKVFKYIDYKDKKLEDYINIFIKHYSNIYEQNNMFFNAEVLWDDYTICINFKILNEKPKETIVWKKSKDIRRFLELAGNKTLNNLFIQKDIKGFESDGFYIIKPNEYKNWHKAIGYLDFYEIDDAILKAGK